MISRPVVAPALKGHPMEIARFRELLGRPTVNGDVEHDWQALEAHSGLNFPDDYK
jgi:hypothetical protein